MCWLWRLFCWSVMLWLFFLSRCMRSIIIWRLRLLSLYLKKCYRVLRRVGLWRLFSIVRRRWFMLRLVMIVLLLFLVLCLGRRWIVCLERCLFRSLWMFVGELFRMCFRCCLGMIYYWSCRVCWVWRILVLGRLVMLFLVCFDIIGVGWYVLIYKLVLFFCYLIF